MNTKNPLFKAYLALAIVCFFWGTTYLAIRIGVQFVPGFMMAGIRNIIAGLITCSYFVFIGTKMPDRKLWGIIFVRALLLIVLGNAMVHWAEESVESGLAAILAATVPLWVAGISSIGFRSVTLNKKSLAGLLLGFAGVLCIFITGKEDLFHSSSIWGVLAMMIAAIGWSLGTVYSSVNKINLPVIFTAGIQMLLGGIISIMISFSIGEQVSVLAIQWQGWTAIFYLVAFGSILSYNSFIYALDKLPATLVGIYAYLNPLVAVFLGWLILDERMDAWVAFGILITLYGVYLVNKGFSLRAITPDK
jgi:drug/metabolite transporter (DMT)-like permease